MSVYKNYIAFLEKHIGDNAIYLHVHGMGASSEDIEKGKKLREDIENVWK